jgi:bacterial/archaeal transporter family protein
MQTWVIYAVLSMIFAGVTAVLPKYGLQNISADFGLGIRTAIIFVSP